MYRDEEQHVFDKIRKHASQFTQYGMKTPNFRHVYMYYATTVKTVQKFKD